MCPNALLSLWNRPGHPAQSLDADRVCMAATVSLLLGIQAKSWTADRFLLLDMCMQLEAASFCLLAAAKVQVQMTTGRMQVI